jgi:hypothetical protein
MLTKLLFRPLPLSPAAPKASLPTPPAALPATAPRVQNTAVRTFQGASVFEPARPPKSPL